MPDATLTDPEREQLQAILQREETLAEHRRLRPYDFYTPHEGGQRQFHQAPHIVRALFPGNGFGKTTAAGVEVAWWVNHCHPWQKVPAWPIIAIWACETFKQFKILRSQLEAECFGAVANKPNAGRPWFNASENCYRWPNGSVLFLISGDSSWTHIQGINPDLVIFDEEPPGALWNEMRMRRRGMRKTRFVFAATATQGITWMCKELYEPWLKYHAEELHLDEAAAIEAQKHPTLWVWPKGGITDNPGADAGDRAWYQSQSFNSAAEREVRLGGGFRDFSGTPVFDLEAVDKQKPSIEAGEVGQFVHVPAINPDDRRCVTVSDPRTGKVQRMRLAWSACGAGERGRVVIYRHPLPGHRYVAGHDSAYGLVTGDFDYAVFLDRNTGEQVAEAQGHWGDAMWAEILFGLGWYYNYAFLCGERQVGLMVMRRMYDEMAYTYQFFHRDDDKADRRPSDYLGHHRMAGDLTIPRLRRAIGPRDMKGRLLESDILLHSGELVRQLGKFQFRPKRSTISITDARDADLEYGAPSGDHDDGVLALGYAQMALHEVAKFKEEELPFPEGSYGEVFKIRETLNPSKKDPDPFEH